MLQRFLNSIRVHAAVLLWLVIPACSTSDTQREQAAVTPSRELARAALDRALAAWRDHGPDAIPKPSPTGISFVDNQRKPTQSLRTYEVLGESMRSKARQYEVRLSLEHPEQTVLATYVVFGRHPLWVYRLEDFDMIMHWEHPMNAEDAASTETSDPGPGSGE
jgi:hypothetical protein